MSKKTLTEQFKSDKQLFEKELKNNEWFEIDVNNIKSFEEADRLIELIRERRKLEKTPEHVKKSDSDYIKAFTWGLSN